MVSHLPVDKVGLTWILSDPPSVRLGLESAGQLGKKVEHPNQSTQTSLTSKWDTRQIKF